MNAMQRDARYLILGENLFQFFRAFSKKAPKNVRREIKYLLRMFSGLTKSPKNLFILFCDFLIFVMVNFMIFCDD